MKRQWNVARKILVAAFVGAALSGAIVGCQSTDTRRSVGETFDDATLTANVKSALASTLGAGSIVSINVDSYRDVVSLNGFVDSQDLVSKAGEAARKVKGVKDVKNLLLVKPKS
jgi:osmotically-inducible protein OsmY